MVPQVTHSPRPVVVLNVDDTPAGRYARTRILQQAGFHVVEAATGTEALGRVTDLPDVVLLDIHLPDIDGREVCRRIRANPRTASVPVVHVTATAIQPAERIKALQNGAEAYLYEPVDPEELIATVWAMVRLRRTTERLRRLHDVTAALSPALRPEEVARVVLHQGLAALEAAAGSVVLLRPGDEIEVLAAVGYPEEVLAQFRRFALAAPLPLAAAARTGQPVWIGSPAELAAQYPHLAQITQEPHYAASAAIPLVVADRLLGAIGLSFVDSRGFEPAEQAFVVSLAEQCAQALERARLYVAEEQARLTAEQKSAHLQLLSDVAAQLLTSQDVDDFVHSLFHRLEAVIDLDAFFHYRTLAGEPGRLRLMAYSGIDSQAAAAVQEIAGGDPAQGLAAAPPGPTVVDNVQQSDEPAHAFIRQAGFTAYAAFPLIRQARTYGTLSFARRGECCFTHEELALMRSAGDLVASASERQQAEAALRDSEQRLQLAKHAAERAADRLARLQSVTAALAGARTPEEVTEVVLERGAAALQAKAISLKLLSADGQWLESAGMLGTSEAVRASYARYPLANTTHLRDAVRTGEPVWCETAETYSQRYPETAAAVVDEGLQATCAIPLRLGQRTIGGLGIGFDRPMRFTPEEREFLLTLAGQCAQALDRARLLQEEQQARSDLETQVARRTAELRQEVRQRREAQRQLEQSREAERTRIARELHDQLGGALTGLKLDLAQLQRSLPGGQAALPARLAELSAGVDGTVALVRRLASELRPPLLDELGLLAALQQHLEEFVRRSGLAGSLECALEDLPLDAEATTACFRIVQEALTNVARHAGATAVRVTLDVQAPWVVVRVADNGRGLDPAALARPGHFGLVGMRERADLVGGTLEVQSAPGPPGAAGAPGTPGTGTTVVLRLPVAAG